MLSYRLTSAFTNSPEFQLERMLMVFHSAALRQQEGWLQNSRDAEIAGLNQSIALIAKKEKGLKHWQGVFDYYENDGEDSETL